MATTLPLNDQIKLTSDKRYQYLLSEVTSQQQIWILTDEHGAVMLNTDDEDCVPVWPSNEAAELWATGDWEGCKPEAISLNKWQQRWTPGLEQDELAIVVYPLPEQDGLVLDPFEFDDDIESHRTRM